MEPFKTWAEVLAAAKSDEKLYYQAPMNHRPTALRRILEGDKWATGYEPKARTLKIYPPGSRGRGRIRTADPFTADAGHLNRFSRESGAAEPFPEFEKDCIAAGMPNLPPGTTRG